jgi:ABC-type glycerol-3-phosphate transport system substrate-binding protein
LGVAAGTIGGVRGCPPGLTITRRGALGGLGAGVIAGCANRRDPEMLRLWAMSYEGDYSPLLMPAFTEATGIEVEVQSLPWTAAHEKLLTAHAGGALPDVLMLPNGWITEFAMIGAIAPVPDPRLVADSFPGVRDTLRYAGREHAVAWSVAPQAQFYRRDILAAAGYEAPATDWDGWRRMGHAIKRRRPDDYAFLLLLNWWDALFTFLGQAGVPVLRDRDTRGNFRTPAARDALDFYRSLFVDKLAPTVLSTEVQDPVAAFGPGFFAVYPSGPSLLLDLHRRRAEVPPSRWATARMPGPTGPAAASAVSAALAVSRTAQRPEAAWALVRHLTAPSSELRLQRLIGNLPARRSAWASPQLATATLAPFAAQVLQPSHDPAIVEWERIRGEIQLIAERLVRGDLTLDAALAEMDRRADLILARRRALVEAGRIA